VRSSAAGRRVCSSSLGRRSCQMLSAPAGHMAHTIGRRRSGKEDHRRPAETTAEPGTSPTRPSHRPPFPWNEPEGRPTRHAQRQADSRSEERQRSPKNEAGQVDSRAMKATMASRALQLRNVRSTSQEAHRARLTQSPTGSLPARWEAPATSCPHRTRRPRGSASLGNGHAAILLAADAVSGMARRAPNARKLDHM